MVVLLLLFLSGSTLQRVFDHADALTNLGSIGSMFGIPVFFRFGLWLFHGGGRRRFELRQLGFETFQGLAKNLHLELRIGILLTNANLAAARGA